MTGGRHPLWPLRPSTHEEHLCSSVPGSLFPLGPVPGGFLWGGGLDVKLAHFLSDWELWAPFSTPSPAK